jgi:hypothetical protein
MHFDFWTILLVITIFAGIQGWFLTIPLVSLMLLYCNWREGSDIDWGWEIGCIIAGPLAFFFAFFEIILLYCK